MTDEDVPGRKMDSADDKTPPNSNAAPVARNGDGRMQLDPTAQAHIGKQLKAIYDGVVNQPVPDRFLELLKQIDKQPPKPRKDLQ
jgi:hypothetical protein